jgi:hypothetical protein
MDQFQDLIFTTIQKNIFIHFIGVFQNVITPSVSLYFQNLSLNLDSEKLKKRISIFLDDTDNYSI